MRQNSNHAPCSQLSYAGRRARTLDLVLDEGEERGEDDGQPGRQRGGQLVAQGLAPACRVMVKKKKKKKG